MRIGAPRRYSRLTWLAIAFAAISTPALAQTAPGHNLPPPCQAQQEFSRKAEAIIARRINAARARVMPGAPTLKNDEQLSRIAEFRSCELARAGKTLSHLDDKGHFESADIIFSLFGLYGKVAENLMEMNTPASPDAEPLDAETFAITAADLWLKSPAHRPHIMDPRYTLSGIGVAMVGGEAVATQVFHGPTTRSASAKSR